MAMFIDTMSGFVFARVPFRGRRTLFAIVLLGMMIPPELYEVVAEILVFVDAMDKIKEKMKKAGK